MAGDVNGDGLVAPIDALLIVNALNQHGEFASDSSLDANRDGRVTRLDVDVVMGQLGGTQPSQGNFAGLMAEGEDPYGPTGPRNPPMANSDAYMTGNTGDRKLIKSAAEGVLANDEDADGDTITAVLENAPSYGTVVLNADGSFEYTPNPGYVGDDSFTYRANDGQLSSEEPAVVTISMPPVEVRILPMPNESPEELKGMPNANNLSGFQVYLVDGPVNFDVTIPFTLPGQGEPGYAKNDVDYSLDVSGSVTIPAGSPGKAYVNLTVLPDQIVEWDEMVAMQLQMPNGPANFRLEYNSLAWFNIQDNDYWKWDQPTYVGEEWPESTIDPEIGDLWVPPLDSSFTASGGDIISPNRVRVTLNALWMHYSRDSFGFPEVHADNLNRELDVSFSFDERTGDITPVTDSGVEGTARLNVATTDISFSYSINNSGTTTKTATVTYSAIAAVGGQWQQGHSGSVNIVGKITGEGGELGAGGSYTGTVSGIGEDGGTAISVDPKIVVLTLRSVED
jgi:hypothetical protein